MAKYIETNSHYYEHQDYENEWYDGFYDYREATLDALTDGEWRQWGDEDYYVDPDDILTWLGRD